MDTDSQWSKHKACFAGATQMWLVVNHNTESLLGNEFDGSVLHRKMSMAAFNQIYVFIRLWQLQKSKVSLKTYFENVN